MATAVNVLRQFNRSYTQRIGVLDEQFLGLARPLGPSRMLWEIGAGGCAVADLREHLGLDSGYVSRLLRSLEAEGLVGTKQHASDGRRRLAFLTAKGQAEWNQLDHRSDELATDLLSALTAKQQERLSEALRTADRLLRFATLLFQVVDPRCDDAASSMDAYFGELDQRFPGGFDPGDALRTDAANFEEPNGAFVVAVSNGDSVACGAVQNLGHGVGEIKRMWVNVEWRGLGLGNRMLAELEQHVGRLGNHTVRLDTNDVLTEAIAMYEAAGYHSIERYNDNPFAKRWFEKPIP